MDASDFTSYALQFCREQMGHLGFQPTADSNAKTVTMQKGTTSILVRVVAFSPEEVMIYVKRDQEKVLSVKLLTTMSSSAYKSLIKRFLILPCCADQSLAAPALSYIPEEFVLNISMYLPIKDLLCTFATNKKMHQLFMRETFPWSELIRRDLHGVNMQVSDHSTEREKYKILYKKATLYKTPRSRCPYFYSTYPYPPYLYPTPPIIPPTLWIPPSLPYPIHPTQYPPSHPFPPPDPFFPAHLHMLSIHSPHPPPHPLPHHPLHYPHHPNEYPHPHPSNPSNYPQTSPRHHLHHNGATPRPGSGSGPAGARGTLDYFS